MSEGTISLLTTDSGDDCSRRRMPTVRGCVRRSTRVRRFQSTGEPSSAHARRHAALGKGRVQRRDVELGVAEQRQQAAPHEAEPLFRAGLSEGDRIRLSGHKQRVQADTSRRRVALT
jgi:hypothetical protein